MSLEDVLVLIDNVLESTENLLDITINQLKETIITTFDASIYTEHKKEIKEYIMNKISASNEFVSDVISPLKDTDIENSNIKPKRKQGGGFTKPLQLSESLSEFLGAEFMARTEVVKKLWEYIKLHNLQDPKDKRFILCDATLEKLFKVKRISMFKMQKPLSAMMKNQHDLQDGNSSNIQDEDDDDDDEDDEDEEEEEEDTKVSSSKKRKQSAKPEVKKPDKTPVKKAKRKSPGKTASNTSTPSSTGGFGQVQVSTELASVLGDSILSRTQVTKQIWVYIKENNLQDPKDKRFILCDEKLEKVFNIPRVSMFGMQKELSKHMSKVDADAST